MSDTDLIVLVVPTRNRPVQLVDMFSSAVSTAARRQRVGLSLYVDDDDQQTPAAYEQLRGLGMLAYTTGPRTLLSATWNTAIANTPWPKRTVFMHGNDDVLFRTPGWDTAVADAFDDWPDRIGCVHGRDGIHDGAMATLGFYSAEWIDALGYFMPPHFSSDYNDTWLSSIADQVGRRRFLPGVYTEHMHPAVGKAPIDQTHRERLDRHREDNVDQLYERLTPERVADGERLRGLIEAAA